MRGASSTPPAMPPFLTLLTAKCSAPLTRFKFTIQTLVSTFILPGSLVSSTSWTGLDALGSSGLDMGRTLQAQGPFLESAKQVSSSVLGPWGCGDGTRVIFSDGCSDVPEFHPAVVGVQMGSR